MQNQQPAEKTRLLPSGDLSVHSIFPTIQGEGPYSGSPAVFIRLAGCNLTCPKCDTDYTTGRTLYSVPEVVAACTALQVPLGLVVITGGEPFRQNITPLVRALLADGYTVQLETNGTLYQEDFPYELVTVVCSPKTGSVRAELWPHITALKYVGRSGNLSKWDGLPFDALGHSAVPKLARPAGSFTGVVYLQPEDSYDAVKNADNLAVCVASCCKFGYMLCLQIHKIIGVQ